MTISIDGYEANVASRVGISRYAFEIIRHVYTLAGRHQVRVYLPDKPRADLPPQKPSWKYNVRGPKKLWTIVGLPLALAVDQPRADVVFSPTHYIPRFTAIPRVMSIMDVSYIRFPELFKAKDIYQLQTWTRYSVNRARKIFTISQFSKHDIMTQYRIPEERVVVTYPGLSLPQAMKDINTDVLATKYQIRSPFILSVGTLQPRKNFARLIEAFAKARPALGKSGSLPTLLIVGKKGWLYDEILSAPEKYHVTDSVRFLDFVPDEDLPALYRSAVCFALPSLYEGFGLPVLEAMAHGCMVVVSATSSLPEIAGTAGIYVSPDSTDDIARGLKTAFQEYGKEAGKARVQKGLELSKKFTWEKAAQKTLETLEEVGKGNT